MSILVQKSKLVNRERLCQKKYRNCVYRTQTIQIKIQYNYRTAVCVVLIVTHKSSLKTVNSQKHKCLPSHEYEKKCGKEANEMYGTDFKPHKGNSLCDFMLFSFQIKMNALLQEMPVIETQSV